VKSAPTHRDERTAWKLRVPLWLVTLFTFGSGLLNLYSVLDSAPVHAARLRPFFPLEFLSLSRSVTVLAGFALAVSSLNIRKRKRRAFWSVLLLALISFAVHVTKSVRHPPRGEHYEEAAVSLALVALLLWARKQFKVRSRQPDWRGTLERLAAALAVAITYGVAGFWLLQPGHFGVNFDWRASIHQTLLYLSFSAGTDLPPQTRYAYWFAHSLHLMAATVVLYVGYVLFRPVLYRFHTQPQEAAVATRILTEYGRSARDFFKVRLDKSFFFSSAQNAFLAYRVGANCAVVLGDPVGPDGEIRGLVQGFLGFCDENDWAVGFHQVLPDYLALYEELGLKKLKIGDEAVVDLRCFSLDGKSARALRAKASQMEKAGIGVRYYTPPVPAHVLARAKEVSDDWLCIPGRRERQFTLGHFEPSYLRDTPVFAIEETGGRMVAFANLIPSYVPGEATIDLMRRRTDSPNGTMDYLFVKLFLFLRSLGFSRFNLGIAPMAGFQPAEHASPEERALHAFFQHLNFLFSFKGLLAYKAKFASAWEPRYIVYRRTLDLPRLALALGQVSKVKGA
jgi:phosphatidylglycerol lysyltransferase